ncbi:MAG: acetolactate synthase large subunit, partial [Lachnospiraceae bacterium]|nr:acetolactate synthase large subunit [Lachnospiraceae bacterium]
LHVIGDVKKALNYMLPLVEKNLHPKWMKQIMAWRMQDYCPVDDESVIKPHQLLQALSDAMENDTREDAIYVTDVGQHQMWAAQYLKHRNPRSFISSGGLGTMGFGYGAAIGAQIACPKNRVVHITGDGSFHMNMNEACTAVSYQLPIITVIMNNSVLGMVRQWQDEFYDRRFAASEPERKTNYVKVIEGFGGKGFYCTNLAEFKEAIELALKEKVPTWIECVIDREERVLPMIAAGKTVDEIVMK